MRKKIFIVLVGTLISLGLEGCGNALNKNSNNIDSPKTTFARRSLTAPFSDLLYGFSHLERYITNGDYDSANTLANNLYDEFHDGILPPLTEKKGEAYAAKVDGKYDELEQAIYDRNKTKVRELIKENRDNLKTIAPILGVTVISSE